MLNLLSIETGQTVFQVLNPIISGHPNVRLSDTPTHETVGHIIKPKVDEVINLARNRESVQKTYSKDIVLQRNAKKTVDFPVNAAIAFYFNQGHSSIS